MSVAFTTTDLLMFGFSAGGAASGIAAKWERLRLRHRSN